MQSCMVTCQKWPRRSAEKIRERKTKFAHYCSRSEECVSKLVNWTPKKRNGMKKPGRPTLNDIDILKAGHWSTCEWCDNSNARQESVAYHCGSRTPLELSKQARRTICMKLPAYMLETTHIGNFFLLTVSNTWLSISDFGNSPFNFLQLIISAILSYNVFIFPAISCPQVLVHKQWSLDCSFRIKHTIP